MFPTQKSMNTDKIKDRMLGCLYGQAIGDALSLGSEFMNKDEVHRAYPDGLCKYEQIIQDAHRRRWPIGAWTDDTDMMLCILSAFENGKVNEGGDADTNGAIACAILGAKFGYSSIPRYYIENLNNRDMYQQKITTLINQITDEKA